jgi:uncharacterized protein YggE
MRMIRICRQLLLQIAVCSVVFSQGAFAQSSSDAVKGISVFGECLVKVAQDRGSVTVANSVVAKSAKEASERAVRAHELLRAEVKKLNLKDGSAETASYQVFEECSYPEGRKVCTGFRAQLSTRFETSEIGKIGEIIAVASSQGSEEVSNLHTLVSPELMQKEREGCLEVATRNALAKAQKMAQGAGVRLGRLVSLSEGGAGEPPVVPFPRAVAMEGMMLKSSAPTIEAKPEDIRVVVSAVYAIE